MLDDLRLYADAYKALTIPWCEKHTGAWWGKTGDPQRKTQAVGAASE